ncbi:MAG TPA: adenylate/guanylate cyclase domain-containing protein [Candidatus Dormibacteraeota bacterium]|nr:adenylate/guanylate cyclase domain-containing protein [Candidatus Dormibacteraeota bacterium]
MTCPACGTENRAGRKFCVNCGTALAAVCPSCGAPVEPSDRFCGECATPLTPSAEVISPPDPAAAGATRSASTHSRVPQPEPVAERRLVTVLFADLVGFTPYAEGRDAEEVRETLDRYARLAGEIVGRYGGTIEKFIGDAVMAVWGTPTAHEDDAERAVRAGLELVDAVPAIAPGLEARAGILTGEAAVTIGAANQAMVAGDLVNTASRLQSVAPSGTVLVGEATVRAADRAIAFEAAGEKALKGKSSPIPSWRAMRVVAERGGRNRSETLEAPFVGRADELRLLKDLFHSMGREGRARLVSVLGPAGIGKTRLAWEFTKYLDGLVENVWWHHGRSPAYGEGIAFWALGEMVRRRAGLLETDDEATTRAKVSATVAEHVPDESEGRWIESALLALLGLDARVASEELFAAWRTFFQRLAATAPVVLAFEDFHHADPGLIDFVDSLMDWSRDSPIYVLALSRPELLERRSDFGVGKRNFTSLYLEPLREPAMRDLLAGLVPGLPESAVRAIVARADGVPLYAVETVRMLVSQGRLRAEGERFVPTGDLSRLDVPETLTALIASRLDALDPAERALVADAAVLGQSFTPAGLEAISGLAPTDLEPHLRTLVRREILRLEADPRSPERGQYAFVQALIREVAYNGLARADRKARHLAAARYFESLGTEELAGALAGHYLAAQASSPEGPEREALATQARIALRAAADRASSLGSRDQAIDFLEQALSITSEPADRADLHSRAGVEATHVSRVDDGERHFRAALEHYRATGDRPMEAATSASLADVLLTAYRFEPALELLREGATRFADLGDDASFIRLRGQLARAYFLHDEDHRAVAASDDVLEVAERLDLVDIVADSLITRGSALAAVGRRYEGVGAIEAGVRLAAQRSLLRTQIRGLINLCALMQDEDPLAGLVAIREAIAIAARLGERGFQLFDNLVVVSMSVGDWAPLDAFIEPMVALESGPSRAVALVDLHQLRTLRGQPVDELTIQLQSLPDVPGDTVKSAVTAWAAMIGAFAAGDYATARAHAHDYARIYSQGVAEGAILAARCSLALRDATGARADLDRSEPHKRRGRALDATRAGIRAGIDALEGRRTEALAGFRAVLEELRDLGVEWDEALCVLDVAPLLGTDEPEVGAALERARGILTRLGAAPFLERLERIAAEAPASTGPRATAGSDASVEPSRAEREAPNRTVPAR